ncbi:MAG: hypothetical protein IAE97_11290, partial [Chthoniobacterales bacterium]|nr:hypothetical protein [Chthoniobacterales bacterium]
MQLIKLEGSKTTQLFWLIAGVLAAVAFLTADQSDPAVTAAGVLLALVSMLPFYVWLLGWSHGLPIWPVFSLVLGMTYALPMFQDPETLDGYSSFEIILGGMTTVGFILLASTIWVFMTSQTPPAPKKVFMIEEEHAVRYLLLFVAGGVLFGLNQLAGWISFPGNLMSVVRGIAMSLNALALFVLAYYQGRGLLDMRSLVLFILGASATMIMGMTSLMLAQAIVPVAMVIFGYMLGSNKLPWRMMALVFVVMAILHAGKYEMRKEYWSGEGPSLDLQTLPQFYIDWFNFGLEELGGFTGVISGPQKEESPSSVFDRSGNLHMLLLVQQKSPVEIPFLNGSTYEPIPRLLIPRFLDDAKGISHAGNIILSMHYGLQTEEQTKTTSIAWGLVPEAYANFGYLGVAALAVVLGIFYSIVTKSTVGVPMTSLRFVLGLLIMAAATKADTMGVFVTTQFQGVVGVSVAALVLMRRHKNPFAEQSPSQAKNPQFVSKRRFQPVSYTHL